MTELALIDTSVAVPLIVADHENHLLFTEQTEGIELGLSGHAAFETYSVLTRLPPPVRRNPETVGRILRTNFPRSVFLSAERAAGLLEELPPASVSGGSVYDALVGAAAAEAGLRLLSGDHRAAETYRQLNVEFELLT